MSTQLNIDNVVRNILDNVISMLNESFDINDLKQVLYISLSNYQFYEQTTELSTEIDCTQKYVNEYLVNMQLNGCTKRSIAAYKDVIKNALTYINKNVVDITYNDIKKWLCYGKLIKHWKDTTYNTKIIVLRGFFSWLYEEDFISNNPTKKLKEAKVEHRVGLTLKPEEREEIRCQCKTEREYALCDFLYSTGARISEVCSLNINDIDMVRMSAIVYGKGKKERKIFFNAATKVHLKKYLSERTDDNPALFVSTRKPYRRMTPDSARLTLINIKNRSSEVSSINLTPHVFRRTIGTDMINKGAPIELVAEKLGHVQIDTTRTRYASISENTVQAAHDKYVS